MGAARMDDLTPLRASSTRGLDESAPVAVKGLVNYLSCAMWAAAARITLMMAVAGFAGCASGGAARIMRPVPPTASEALGNGSRSPERVSSLAIDLPSSERAELERAIMQKAVVLVDYDGTRLRLLPACSPVRLQGIFESSFRYEGVTTKEDVVRMADTDSVRARLPLSGPLLAAKLEGELARGSSLDLGLVTVGRFVANTKAVHKPDLPRECATATHFVTAATVGAFAMSVGSRATARAAAEIFGAGTAGASASTKSHLTRDGSLDACKNARLLEPAPPEGCRALLELALAPLDPRRLARARCEETNDVELCTDWADPALRQEPFDPVEGPLAMTKLVELCTKGYRLSACLYARKYERLEGLPPIDLRSLMENACRLGSGVSCLDLADVHDREGNNWRAFTILDIACNSAREGRVTACTYLAERIEKGEGPEPPEGRAQRVADLDARLCVMPPSFSCERYAKSFSRGLRGRGDFSVAKTIVRCMRSPDQGRTPRERRALQARRLLPFPWPRCPRQSDPREASVGALLRSEAREGGQHVPAHAVAVADKGSPRAARARPWGARARCMHVDMEATGLWWNDGRFVMDRALRVRTSPLRGDVRRART